MIITITDSKDAEKLLHFINNNLSININEVSVLNNKIDEVEKKKEKHKSVPKQPIKKICEVCKEEYETIAYHTKRDLCNTCRNDLNYPKKSKIKEDLTLVRYCKECSEQFTTTDKKMKICPVCDSKQHEEVKPEIKKEYTYSAEIIDKIKNKIDAGEI